VAHLVYGLIQSAKCDFRPLGHGLSLRSLGDQRRAAWNEDGRRRDGQSIAGYLDRLELKCEPRLLNQIIRLVSLNRDSLALALLGDAHRQIDGSQPSAMAPHTVPAIP